MIWVNVMWCWALKSRTWMFNLWKIETLNCNMYHVLNQHCIVWHQSRGLNIGVCGFWVLLSEPFVNWKVQLLIEGHLLLELPSRGEDVKSISHLFEPCFLDEVCILELCMNYILNWSNLDYFPSCTQYPNIFNTHLCNTFPHTVLWLVIVLTSPSSPLHCAGWQTIQEMFNSSMYMIVYLVLVTSLIHIHLTHVDFHSTVLTHNQIGTPPSLSSSSTYPPQPSRSLCLTDTLDECWLVILC